MYVGSGTVEFLCRWLTYLKALRSEVQRCSWHRILFPTPKEECDQ
jgi:hypothetical protein